MSVSLTHSAARLLQGGVCLLAMASAMLGPEFAHAQAAMLDDRSLGAVTALTRSDMVADPSGPSAVPGTPVPGTERGDVSAVVTSGARATIDSTVSVDVGEQSQSAAMAVNLVNAVAADVASGVNVFRQSHDRSSLIASHSSVAQENQLVQEDSVTSRVGLYGRFEPSYRVETQQRYEAASSYDHSRQIGLVDRRVAVTSRTTRFSATANAERPDLLDGLSIGNQVITLPDFTIGPDPFTIEIPTPGDLVDAFKVTISPPQLDVSGATISTGGISFEDDKIVFSAPVLTLPDLDFRFCLLKKGCGGDNSKKRTLTIKGRSFALGPGRSLDNPVTATGIGVGYAIAGSGRVETEDGNIHISGSIPIDFGAIVDLALTVSVPVFGDVDISLDSLNLPVIRIPVNFNIPLEVPDDVELAVENEACVFSNGTRECNPIDVTSTEFEQDENGYSETANSEQVQTEEYYRQRTVVQRADVTVGDAEARFIVVDHSSAEVSTYSVVLVDDNSQIDVRTLNLVNAAMGIIGNGLNVGQARANVTKQADTLRQKVAQENRITQIGGL